MAQASVRTRSGRLPALIITLRGTAVEHPLSACLAEQTRSIGPIKSAHRVKRRTIVLFTSSTRSTTCAPDSGRRCNLPIFANCCRCDPQDASNYRSYDAGLHVVREASFHRNSEIGKGVS